MITQRSGLRSLVVGLAVLFGSAMMGGVATPASATPPAPPPTYNNVVIDIQGGNAQALSACVNYAKVQAKKGKPAQSNSCKNFAKAEGGNVKLKDVTVTILQTGNGGPTYNNTKIDISGGDAEAVAACVNYLQGTQTGDQTNKCQNSAVAIGGNVELKDVNIAILQG